MTAPARRIPTALPVLALALALAAANPARAHVVVDFEDLVPGPGGFTQNSDPGFQSRGAFFNNRFADFGFFTAWSGWAYSNVDNPFTPGFMNQYASAAGLGFGGPNYAVAFAFNPGDAWIDLPAGLDPVSVRITNTAYAYFAIRDGDPFSSPFGPGDFFRLTITGHDSAGATGSVLGAVVLYLADFRDGRSDILNAWELLDLAPLAGARSLGFALESSDVDPVFGMNTPAYFALDDLVLAPASNPSGPAVPEPAAPLLAAVALLALAARAARRRFRTRPLF